MDENDKKDPSKAQPDKDQPNNELAWVVIIALLIGLLLLSGYGFVVIYKAIESVLIGSTGSLPMPNPPF